MKITGSAFGGTINLDVTLSEREERLLLFASALQYGTPNYHPDERVARAIVHLGAIGAQSNPAPSDGSTTSADRT
jgi:hypothetical protein